MSFTIPFDSTVTVPLGQINLSFNPNVTVSGFGGSGITVQGTPTVSLTIGNEQVGANVPVDLTLPPIPTLINNVLGGLGLNSASAITTGSGQDTAVSGNAAKMGSSSFGGNSTMLSASAVKVGSSPASFGADSVSGSSSSSLLSGAGSSVITNFLSGAEKLVLEGNALSYLSKLDSVSSHGSSTIISLDGGKTTIEMVGMSSDLKSTDLTHKH